MKKTEKDVVDEIKEEKPTIKKKTKKENDIEVIKNKTEVEAKKKSKNNEEKVEEKVQENKDINPKESSEDSEKDKLLKIVNNAKAKGKITYGELAAELGEANSEQIDKVLKHLKK